MGISPSFVLPVRAESTEYKVFGRIRRALWRSGREAEGVSLGVDTPRLASKDGSLHGNAIEGLYLGTVRGGVTRGLESETLDA